MTDLMPTDAKASFTNPSALRLLSGEDRFGEFHGIGLGSIDFKISSRDSSDIFIAEARLHMKGGPAKHLHYEQDEWFYVTKGEFLLELGAERFALHSGDSAFGPRMVPHAWAFVGEGTGRILFAFTPPGKMEAFFQELAKFHSPAPQAPEFWPRFGLEMVGPPLKWE